MALRDLITSWAYRLSRWFPSEMQVWMNTISDDTDADQANIAALQAAVAALQTRSGTVVQTQYTTLAADTTFSATQIIQTTTITTTTVNGVLEIWWTASCTGNTVATFYAIFLQVDGVTKQASRFTLDAASANFGFSLGGVFRLTGVAPGAHVVRLQAQPGGASTMTFTISGPDDNASILVKEVLP